LDKHPPLRGETGNLLALDTKKPGENRAFFWLRLLAL
jgi:hypothetical protein